MGPQIVAAVVGASAAILAQIVTIIAQYILKNREISLEKSKIKLAAYQNYETRRLDAFTYVFDQLYSLLDDDKSALEVYRDIRPHWMFFSPDTQDLVRKAIREKNQHGEGASDKVGESFLIAFSALKNENKECMRFYYD
ncbi:MAG: hypothetical protein AAFX09_05445 [Pseudomonadota bacterium]